MAGGAPGPGSFLQNMGIKPGKVDLNAWARHVEGKTGIRMTEEMAVATLVAVAAAEGNIELDREQQRALGHLIRVCEQSDPRTTGQLKRAFDEAYGDNNDGGGNGGRQSMISGSLVGSANV